MKIKSFFFILQFKEIQSSSEVNGALNDLTNIYKCDFENIGKKINATSLIYRNFKSSGEKKLIGMLNQYVL